MGMIITQISNPDRQVDLGDLQSAQELEGGGEELTEPDPDEDAEGDPEGQPAFKQVHGGAPAACLPAISHWALTVILQSRFRG
jgi:hypothetical protein